jgi:ABC-type cobalamin/Fe3+-siderophores transport system ATPase subunit
MSEDLIRSIRVKQLFGMYTYDVGGPVGFSNAAILYGDNGVGKSTVLRLAFNLLSAANDRGRRTAIASIPFLSLEVDLTSGITVSAQREEVEDSRIKFEIVRNREHIAGWNYEGDKQSREREFEHRYLDEIETLRSSHRSLTELMTKRLKTKQDEKTWTQPYFLAALKSIAPVVFLLNAERRLDSDTIADADDQVVLRHSVTSGNLRSPGQMIARAREIALAQALAAAHSWISRKAVISANVGSHNVQELYLTVLKHLKAGGPSGATGGTNSGALIERLDAIEKSTADVAKFEFLTPLDMSPFKNILAENFSTRNDLVADILDSYARSIERRLEALHEVSSMVARFTEIINGLFRDKILTYRLSSGFTITARSGKTLDPGELSSGEQQLLLLLCYVLTRRDDPSVFMIDEPEISLNIKWQRSIVQALLDLTTVSKIQFIFASHSMELITPHRDRVVQLVDES